VKRGAIWTTEKPTGPGFWWFRTRSAKVGMLQVIRIRGGQLGCLMVGVADPYPPPDPEGNIAWGPQLPKPGRWSEARPTEPGFYWVEGPKLLRTVGEYMETPNGYQFLLPGRPWSPDAPLEDEILEGCAWSPIRAPKP
jgi:hypothetical protein